MPLRSRLRGRRRSAEPAARPLRYYTAAGGGSHPQKDANVLTLGSPLFIVQVDDSADHRQAVLLAQVSAPQAVNQSH